MSRTLRLILIIAAALAAAVCVAFFAGTAGSGTDQSGAAAGSADAADKTQSAADGQREEVTIRDTESFADNSLLYDYDLCEMQYLYVTVVEGSASEGTDHTLAEVDSYINAPGMEKTAKLMANAIVKAGDENGPAEGMLGYGKTSANATINVRGRTSTGYEQKSYKLELFKNAGFWNGQRTIALNKHPGDSTRIRNALYFKLMREVPSLISLRTWFVHLYVCDATASGDGSGEYQDYGLYTAVEQPNGRFLKNHGLSTGGSLYKAYMFEFQRYEDALRLTTDPDYDAEAFSAILEPKADTTDHSKLLEMLDAVNNDQIPVEQLIDRYFDIDNLLDYMAFNMLLVNADSDAQNFYLYSPADGTRWYLICWDGDGALKRFEWEYTDYAWKDGEWTHGISMYSANVLFRRIMCSETYRNMLTERVNSLYAVLSGTKLAEEIAPLHEAVLPLMSAEPDRSRLELSLSDVEAVLENMPSDVETGYREYLESLKKPLPFYLDNVTAGDGKLQFAWGEAYDFNGELVNYRLTVADDISLSTESIVYQEELFALSTEIGALPPGDYYFQVIAENASGYTRLPYDQMERAGIYEGRRGFTVQQDGTVVMMDE